MSPLPPAKYGITFFVKMLAWGAKFFEKIYWGMFYMGTNDQIVQGRKLMVMRFQRSSQVSFPLIYPDLDY